MKKSKKQPFGNYVILLDSSKSIRNTQKHLGVSLINSAELGDKFRAKDVYAQGSGIVFKNLNVAVLKNIEEARLLQAKQVLYWEKERLFYPVGALDILAEVKATIKSLKRQVQDMEVALAPSPDPPPGDRSKMTWGMKAIGINTTSLRGRGVKVAVLDTGLDVDHPNFSGRRLIGKSFVQNEAWERDGVGHGSHCAGTIAGGKSKENGLRFGGAPKVSLIIGKVLSDKGFGSTSEILDGIDWSLEKGAQIISMSLGASVNVGEAPSKIFERVGDRALGMNCLIVAAAGNESKRPNKMPRPVNSPANTQSIMAVAALDRNLRVAGFSNGGINAANGGRIDLAAPGVDVYSSYSGNATQPGKYLSLNGTSMAVPHVAAIAALMLEKEPKLSAIDLWKKMEKAALSLDGQHKRDVGKGLVRIP